MVSDDNLVMVGREGDGAGVKWGLVGLGVRETGNPRGERYWSGQQLNRSCILQYFTIFYNIFTIFYNWSAALEPELHFAIQRFVTTPSL